MNRRKFLQYLVSFGLGSLIIPQIEIQTWTFATGRFDPNAKIEIQKDNDHPLPSEDLREMGKDIVNGLIEGINS